MPVRKAVITAGGYGTRQFPATRVIQKELLPIVDADGVTKPALQLIVAEALAAGVEEIGIVARPGAEQQIRQLFSPLSDAERHALAKRPEALAVAQQLEEIGRHVAYIYQREQLGYGHAVFCSRQWVGDEPFLLMLGDHLYISETDTPCARQLVEIFDAYGANLSSVAATPASQLHLFGTVKGEPIGPGLYRALRLIEKPSPELAERELTTPGLPPGHYLCFFGMHVFTPTIFDCLAELIRGGITEKGEFQLTTAQEMLRQQEPYLAYVIRGRRYDIGTPDGYLEALAAFGRRTGCL
ncbi:MAG: UTP--glucose-1-phosphate uridylyltransferase [Armatimonadetes bacterium]|nr:UTP--glucose-1-phosphate uridylyltransferase [Armatimonadota bacterium]